jgi:hypothetical protein
VAEPAAPEAVPARPAPESDEAWQPPPPLPPPHRSTVARRDAGRPPRWRRRGAGRPLIVLAVLIFALAGGALSFIGSAVDRLPGGALTVGPPAQAPSLLRPAPLKAALARLPHGRVTHLRVAPGRIDAQVYVKRHVHVVWVDARSERTDTRTAVTVRRPALTIHPAAPLRIARAAARASHHRLADVSHLVLNRSGWELFFRDGTHFHANAAGRHVKRAG